MITATEAKEKYLQASKELHKDTHSKELVKQQVIAKLQVFFDERVKLHLEKDETGFTVTESEIKLGISDASSSYGLMDLASMLLLDYGYHVRVLSKSGEMMLEVFWDDYIEVTYSISYS